MLDFVVKVEGTQVQSLLYLTDVLETWQHSVPKSETKMGKQWL